MPNTPTRIAPVIQHKAFASLETKVVDQAQGIVEALVAVTGNTDQGGDVIKPGAFTFKRNPKIVWSHDLGTLVGKVTAHEELKPHDPRLPADLKSKGFGALKFTMQFDMEDDESKRAFRKVVFHDDLGWSIGYTVPAGGSKKLPDGTRELKSVEVWEASPVTFGMNAEARTLEAKSAAVRTIEELGLDDEQKGAVEGLLALRGGPDDLDTKAWPPLADSFEETSERIREAVNGWAVDQFGDRSEENYWYCSVEGTFDANAVVTVRAAGESVSYRFPYTVTDGVVELGEPEAVTIRTTVQAGGTPVDEVDPGTEENMDVEDDKAAEITPEEKALLIEHLGEVKAGRVLSSANRSKIRQALTAIQEVLAAGGADDETDDSKTDDKKGMEAISADEFAEMLEAIA